MIAMLTLSACSLALPGESYTSSDCGHFAPVTIQGEWVPTEYVEIDHGLCVENERYIVDGVARFNVYDGPPPCSPITLGPPPVIVPPVVVPPTATPEASSAGYVLIGMVSAVAALVIKALKGGL